MKARAASLELISLDIPDAALEPFEAALRAACATVAMFRDEDAGIWLLEGVREAGTREAELAAGLALAAALTGIAPAPRRAAIAAEGWAARSYASFPEQRIGARFALRGSHIAGPKPAGRIVLTLDAGAAFGSGEHGSTRGCLRALEVAARLRPSHILDLGTGSGVLAMAAARLLRRRVLASDIDPWSVRVAAANARRNGLAGLVAVRRGDGWAGRAVREGRPYDLVLANILARPLCRMARALGTALAPGGRAILAGLLETQSRAVLAAHRRAGLVLQARFREGAGPALLLAKPDQAARGGNSGNASP
ncbi:MAG: 50S ribosomal protein L11 methyltransferase [Rhodospirillales bacterium]|nr:50S ribosomal protein L11 methyltransferase [Rhodospirillales bacterium]